VIETVLFEEPSARSRFLAAPCLKEREQYLSHLMRRGYGPGYSNDGDLVSRMAISRHRSLLVRSYLVERFQLVPGNVDSVALQDQSPKGVGHSTWNGVSILVLKAQP
jgi:hypothetical protein